MLKKPFFVKKIGMDKYYTSMEQGKKLVELGIDVSTADMQYSKMPFDDDFFATPDIKDDRSIYDVTLPAWSLVALLRLIPLPTLQQDKFDDVLAWQCSTKQNDLEIQGKWSESPVDACFELINVIASDIKTIT